MNREAVERLRNRYPTGTRIMLDYMEDIQAVPAGTKGTVDHVDDVGTIWCYTKKVDSKKRKMV